MGGGGVARVFYQTDPEKSSFPGGLNGTLTILSFLNCRDVIVFMNWYFRNGSTRNHFLSLVFWTHLNPSKGRSNSIHIVQIFMLTTLLPRNEYRSESCGESLVQNIWKIFIFLLNRQAFKFWKVTPCLSKRSPMGKIRWEGFNIFQTIVMSAERFFRINHIN